MKKINKNYALFLNVLLFSGLIIFLSGCGRERTAMSSTQYEKLRKQSIEIENGKTLASEVEYSKPYVSNGIVSSNSNAGISEDKLSAPIIQQEALAPNTKKTEGKISLAEKVLAKKIAKKLNVGQQTAQLDPYLKYALIFGAAGLILSIFGYPLYFIGGILMIVALVFLILWLLEQ
jgi:hypothetical protein